MQYLFHSLTANRHRAHINRYIEEVKEVAWRPHGGNPPISGAKKYVTLPDQSEGGDGTSRKFAIEFDGSVFLVDPKTGEESLLDVNEIEGANWKRTLIYVLPVSIWNGVAQRVLKKKEKVVEESVERMVREGNRKMVRLRRWENMSRPRKLLAEGRLRRRINSISGLTKTPSCQYL